MLVSCRSRDETKEDVSSIAGEVGCEVVSTLVVGNMTKLVTNSVGVAELSKRSPENEDDTALVSERELV